ncbi:MAG TPA: hypothetical protein VD997_12105 [Phycisphaerales bacterium]|nr:hypothetical protein [Phycisphaerales bacterium]
MSRTAAVAALAAGCVLTALAGHAATIEVIYSRASGGPTATVPGAVDLSGNPATASFNSMLEFWLSPDGSKWLLRGSTSQPTAESDAYLLLGSGTSGSVVLQEGRPFPGAVGSEVIEFFSSTVSYPFNAQNDWAFAFRARGGVAANQQKIVRYTSAGAGVLRFQQGDAYSGLTDNPDGNAGNETIGNSPGNLSLRNNGAILWHDPNPSNLSSTRYPIAALDGVRYLQSNADTVTRLDGSGPVGLSRIASFGTLTVLQTSADGTRVVVRGAADLDGNNAYNAASDPDIVVVDGAIRVQAGQPLPGDSSLTVLAINQIFIAGNNDWYARGTTSSGAWAVKNGTVIAKTGDAVGSDTWGAPTFFTITGNSSGDWLVAGKTTNPDPAVDDVVVVNGNVVAREGDPVSVDTDGDGSPETVFIGRSNNTLAAFGANSSAGLAPDGTAYIIANLRTAAGADLAPAGVPYALLRISPGGGCAGNACGSSDYNGDGDFGTDQDIEAFFACIGGNCCDTCFCQGSDFNGDGDFGTDQDIEAFFRVLGGNPC